MLTLALGPFLSVAALQEPSPSLERDLTAPSAWVRQEAARELASGDGDAEAWLLHELDRGSPPRRRALLYAAALRGSDDCFAALERAARRERRPEPNHAFALLLYGTFHPDAGTDPEADWKRAASDGERAFLVAGLLSRPERLGADAWRLLAARHPNRVVLGLLDAGELLLGRSLPAGGDEPVRASARLLTSVLPQQRPLSGDEVDWTSDLTLPLLWRVAARRDPPRTLDDLRGSTPVGAWRGLALALYELPADQRQEAFLWLRPRLRDAEAVAWAWGAAGDLGLDLPAPIEGAALVPGEVAGILRLALHRRAEAVEAAAARLEAARRAFRAGRGGEDLRLAAALVLALAGGEGDRELLREAIRKAAPRWRVTLQPVWRFAERSLDDPALERAWLTRWARRLGAGALGYLDAEGPRLVALVLAGGTQAAEESLRLAEVAPRLQALAEHDFAVDADVWADVVAFLLGPDYRWDAEP